MRLQRRGRAMEAAKVYREVLQNEPDEPDALHLLGLALGDQHQDEAGVALIERAIQLRPRAAAFQHNIGGVYRRMGRLAEAVAAFRRALELKPEYGEAFQGLAETVRLAPDDPAVVAARKVLERSTDSSVRCYLHFALGKVCDDAGQYEDAFHHVARGNALAGRSFDVDSWRRQVRETLYEFSPSLIRALGGAGDPTGRPVFVVGMPRSGTTLVEQILASHSQVHGAGELTTMRHVLTAAVQEAGGRRFPEFVPGLGRAGVASLASAYLAGTREFAAPGITRVVDKHPLNFQFIGLILLMFPNARVIHTVRHPLDTCLSCFFQHFTSGQDYTFDLIQLGHFYRHYRRLMEYWEQLFPGRILHLQYEHLVRDQQTATGRLLDYCGLEFEQTCVDFHQTERVVRTASFLQVRRPLYATSIGKYRLYAEHLRELAQMLGVRLDGPALTTEQPR